MAADGGIRRGVASIADEIAWRIARDAGERRGDGTPVAVRAGLGSARALLAIIPGGLASVMTALPAVRALRRELPHARFDLLAEPLAASLLARDPLFQNTLGWLPLPALRQRRAFNGIAAKIADREYDVVCTFAREDDRGIALIAQAAGARLRLASLAETSHSIYNVRVVPRDGERYLVDRYLGFMESLGMRAPVDLPVWDVPEREAEVAERLLRLKHLKGAHPLIAFDPGPGEGEEPDDRMAFGAFAQAVARKAGARGIILSETEQHELPGSGGASPAAGLPKDTERDEARAMGLAGLRETLSVLSRCDAFVGRNTGFFHAAVSFGLPSVGLFPRGGERWWHPENHPGVLILEADGEAAANAQLATQHLLAAWSAGVPGGAG